MRVVKRSSIGIEAKEKSVTVGNVKLVLSRDRSVDEWVVKWYENGTYSEDKSYRTDDKDDAEGTMKLMEEELKAKK